MGALSDAKPMLPIAAGELHLHPAVLTFVILAAAVLISFRIIPSLDFLVVRQRAAGEPRLMLHPTATVEAAAAPAGSAPRSPLADFVVLCLAMATVLHAEPLVHAAELRLGPAAAVFAVLTTAALFNWVIVSINHFVAHRPAEREPRTPPPLLLLLQLRRTGPAAYTTTVRHSSLARPAFVVLAALTSASWFVELLVHDAELRLGPAAAVFGVLTTAALFNWVIVSIINHFAPRPAEREPRTLLLQLCRTAHAASMTTVRPSSLARPAFVVLAALTSVSWFVEPFVHAAELRFPRVAVVITVALFAALFNLSVHSFRSFFLTRRPPVAAA